MVRVLALLCPDCGAGLRGLSEDRVFFCPTCPRGFSVRGDADGGHALVGTPLRYRAGDGDLYLPFWRLRCRPTLRAEDGAAPAPLDRFRLDDEVEVLVKGFAMSRILQVGNPGLELTRRASSLPTTIAAPDPLPRVLGCRRTADAARSYAELFLLEILDRQADITGVRLDLGVQEITLDALPFLDRGDAICCASTGLRWPAAVVEDLQGMRG